MRATYEDIQNYVKTHHGFTVKTCWIAHMKEVCGLKTKKASNRIDPVERKYPCPEDKQKYILEAFKVCGWIRNRIKYRN